VVLGSSTLLIKPISKQQEAILVASINAGLRLFREGGWQRLPECEALKCFEAMDRISESALRRLVSEASLSRTPLSDLNFNEVLTLIRKCLRNGEAMVLRKSGNGTGQTEDETTALRRLVRAILAQTHGRLSFSGRQYRLVVDVDIGRVPERDRYMVVRHEEGHRVISALAAQSGIPSSLAKLLSKAGLHLTRDWRPPFSPDGLVLLRRSNAPAGQQPTQVPTITPSQMLALLEEEKPVQFFARFVDEWGKTVTGFTGKFEHGSDPECDMPFASDGFSRTGELKGAKPAWLRIPDPSTPKLIDALKKRWQEIRGKADESWKKKEERLVEVLFKEGKLPELQLEAEKKHTFMLRPPVALAHLHGTYFDTNKSFILPMAVASLKRLVEIYALHPDSELLIAGHTDTAGSESYNLDLSADRADAMKAYLRDDADTWLAWYETSVRDSKRWGAHEDSMMIDALVPEEMFSQVSHITAYQTWHNSKLPDARQPDETYSQPKGWEELNVDGLMGPKTRRQLILDYMNLDATSLPENARVVSYGCGEYCPLESEEGDVDTDANDGKQQQFNRRVEVFFFAKPFGILPKVPGVADGESPAKAVKAAKGDKNYPEWRVRATHRYTIEAEADGFRLRLCDADLVPYAERPFAFCLEGYPEIRGTTDKDGFAIIDSPPAGAQGYIELWPDDKVPEDKIRWDISIATIISPATPRGASTRLANLDYFADDPIDEMTDELRDAISYFQGDCDGLEVTGELNGPTCNRLRHMHDCESGNSANQAPVAPEAATT
jgi:hypothetical protein